MFITTILAPFTVWREKVSPLQCLWERTKKMLQHVTEYDSKVAHVGVDVVYKPNLTQKKRC